MARRWIQKAIKRKGSLKRYMKQRYGKKAFTNQGTIKVEYLKRALKHAKGSFKKRIHLALTLRRLRKRK